MWDFEKSLREKSPHFRNDTMIFITNITMDKAEKDQDEGHNLTEQNNVVEGAAGYHYEL
jgi:hypothetical protein